MTREVAIRRLLNIERSLPNTFRTKEDVRNFEALDMAIKALEQEPTDENLHREREQAYMQGYEDASKRFRQEPSGDAINRQAALDAMYELCNTGETLEENPWRDNPHIDAIIDAIDNLPSVKQEPKYCDRNICVSNEYNGIGCENCEVTKSQEPRVGHWIEKYTEDGCGELYSYWACSECGRSVGFNLANIEDVLNDYPYCHCGARMVEPQESEDKE